MTFGFLLPALCNIKLNTFSFEVLVRQNKNYDDITLRFQNSFHQPQNNLKIKRSCKRSQLVWMISLIFGFISIRLLFFYLSYQTHVLITRLGCSLLEPHSALGWRVEVCRNSWTCGSSILISWLLSVSVGCVVCVTWADILVYIIPQTSIVSEPL